MNPTTGAPRNPLTALVLGWVLPGAGHFYGGQRGKGILFFCLITGTIVAGLLLSRGTNLLPNRLWYAAQICGGGPALTLTPISQHYSGRGPIDWADRLHEVGTLYTAVAGFLNLLVMMDAYVRLAYPRREEDEAGVKVDESAREENV
jgi:TM2 domain-containing membrane protein YozV